MSIKTTVESNEFRLSMLMLGMLFFGVLCGVVITSTFYTAAMTDVMISSTEMLADVTDLAVDYVNLVKACNVTMGGNYVN